MRVNSIKASLQRLKMIFRNIWEDGAEVVIDGAVAELERSKKTFDERRGKTHHPGLESTLWGYRIYPTFPLCFKRSLAMKGIPCWLDLYCKMLWKDEEELPVQQDITVRLWSNELDYIYREDWDSPKIWDGLTDARVMARWHFDLANPGQDGPKYHLQFGGNAREKEWYWFPEIISLPRFTYPPMDLILICQMIAANFYYEDYSQLRKTPEWMSIVRKSQTHLALEYYQSCVTAIERERSLLDDLWNI